MKNFIPVILFLFLALPGFSQEIRIGCAVRGVYKKSILKENLLDAKTMKDINPGFPSSWINRYFSVEVSATCNGKQIMAASENDMLTAEQQSILKKADLGTDIIVDIKYNFKSSTNDENNVREINFSYTVIPAIEAEFPGGQDVLNAFLKERTVDKLSTEDSKKLEVVIARFTVNEDGNAVDAHITTSSGDEKTDQLLLKTICDMPEWAPAVNMNGVKVKQEFEISVGYMIGC